MACIKCLHQQTTDRAVESKALRQASTDVSHVRATLAVALLPGATGSLTNPIVARGGRPLAERKLPSLLSIEGGMQGLSNRSEYRRQDTLTDEIQFQ